MADKAVKTTFLSGSAEIYYEIYGEGEPLILLHGNNESIHESFDGQIEAFAKEYKVIAMDSRGHGKSDLGEETLNIIIMSQDVMALMDHLEIDKAYILGVGDGGNIAMRLCSRYQDRFMGAVFSGASMNSDGIKFRYLFPMWLKQIFNIFRAMSSPQGVRDREVHNLMLKFPQVRRFHLADIACPVLVTAGENDIIRPDHTKRIAHYIEKCELHIFEGCDRFVYKNEPERYNALVLEFLNKYSKKGKKNGKKTI